MKNISQFLKFSLIALILTSVISCNDDEDTNGMKSNSIIDFVEANKSNYGILLTALQRADGDLVNVLNGNGPFTVFAPNDAAFNTYLTANGFANIEEVPSDVLSQILLNHVISGSVESSALTTGYIKSLSTLTPSNANLSMYVNIENGVTLNGISKVTSADNLVDNGIIHLVDAVIPIPTIVTFATSDSSFNILVAALTRADQPDFVSTLLTQDGTDPAPFTVFAPTDQAFVDLLNELGANSLDDIDAETLTSTLNHHVVASANVFASDLSDDQTISTLGGEIKANISGGASLTDANDRISNIIAVDVQASNGIIHVIDKVILPPLGN